MQQLPPEVRDAVLAQDWQKAITLAEEGAAAWAVIVADVVNLARTVGEKSDADVARMRGTSASAVNQRFGPRATLLRQMMREEWERAAQENRGAEQSDP